MGPTLGVGLSLQPFGQLLKERDSLEKRREFGMEARYLSGFSSLQRFQRSEIDICLGLLAGFSATDTKRFKCKAHVSETEDKAPRARSPSLRVGTGPRPGIDSGLSIGLGRRQRQSET